MSARDIDRLADVARHASGQEFTRQTAEGRFDQTRNDRVVIRAILKAMRDPGDGELRVWVSDEARRLWQAQIDQLLAE